MSEDRLLKLTEVAERLRVSPATLRNWVRLGLLAPDAERPFRFLPETVTAFRRAERGEKLTSRANKSRSQTRQFRGPFRLAVTAFRSLHLGLDHAMYLAALKRLAAAGELELQTMCYRRKSVRAVMEEWASRQPAAADDGRQAAFFAALPPMEGDESLGELHQALMQTGCRSLRGAYYTATELADAAICFGAGARSFLDPCCGSGHYLVRAATVLVLEPEQIYGIEYDQTASELARINLLLAFPGREFTPNIHRGNALTGRILKEKRGSFDLVATNPPWGAGESGREESFSRFLRQALRFLSPGGKLSFLLPEAALNVRTHAPLRKQLLEMCRIETVTLLGRCFSGVFTPVIRLDAVNLPPGADHAFRVVRHDGELLRLEHNTGKEEWAIEPELTTEDAALIAKIYRAPHLTLAGNAEWALGIVTGDNARLLASDPEPGATPILRGRDILPNELLAPQRYLRPGRFQQSAPERLYKTVPKIVYRFIADRPVCAVDREGVLTLNSANVLIPQLPGWTVELAARFLNSKLVGYLFIKRFAARKVLRKDLERLPFPALAATEAAEWKRLSAEALDGQICSRFGLTASERALIERAVQ